MAIKQSAGLLVYRLKNGQPEVLIVHPGGPFFIKKDNGFWSIPKGLYEDVENPFDAAKREFEEEIGASPPPGEYIDLGEIKRKDGKTIKAWAIEGDINEDKIQSNTFEIEWPLRSGEVQEFPEVDRASWFDLKTASQKLQIAQATFLERLAKHLKVNFLPDKDSASSPEQYRLL